MLNRLPRETDGLLFPGTLKSRRLVYCKTRKRLAQKLQNPRLLKIRFHTFRHWKATMEYHKTKDILHVKQLLGHKSVINTEIYIHIEQALYSQEDAEYITRVASSLKGARALLEAGFEYVTDMNGYKIFRKRK